MVELRPSTPGPLSVESHQHELIARDGISLHSRIWRPRAPGPWPALLMRQPYGNRIASTVTYAHPHWYASHGFAVMVQDVRGRGDSGGRFGGFQQEPADMTDTLIWLRQQPWCSGRVGTYGFSYQGLSQLLCSDADHLPDALAPAMAGLDERQHWASEGGAHWWALGLAWAMQLAAQECQRRNDTTGWQQLRRSLNSGAFLDEGFELLQRFDPEGMGLDWLQRDPRSPGGWRRHQPPAAIWRRPMLLVGGWHDPHLRGVLDLWQQASGGHPQSLLRIGAWSHLRWNGGIDRLQLAFFRLHLQNDTTPRPAAADATTPVLLEDLANGHWQTRTIHHCSGQRWSLRSGGLAAIDPQEGELQPDATGAGTVVLVHDPWRPLPGRGGHLGLDAGPTERSDLDQRSDVACFTTAPLQRAMELLGQPQLRISVAADQPGFDLCAALSLLGPDGRVRQMSTGVARFLGPGCLQTEPRLLRLQPLLLSLQPGEQLRLSLGAAAWPQISVNPGDGRLPREPVGPGHRVISLTLELAEAELSITPMLPAN